MKKIFITPDDWLLADDERSTVEPDPSCRGWFYICAHGADNVYLHIDEIEALYKATREEGKGCRHV